MQLENAKIISNKLIGKDVYKMVLETSIAQSVTCGQFVEVEVPGYFLRRPISVCEVSGNTITLVYKVVGEGTKVMSSMKEESVSLLGPCGTGFPIEEKEVLLIGGGVGVPPLLETAKQYKKLNQKVTLVMGFNSKDDVILEKEFKNIVDEIYIATMDGSSGTKGTVIDAICANDVTTDFVLSCGPLPMLKVVNEKYSNGYISLEARMACGLGACMGCVVKDTEDHSLRVCKDGPVFKIGSVKL